MGQHFLLHRDLVAATAVHHATRAHLSNDTHADLVIVSPQALRIYRIEPFSTAAAAAARTNTTTNCVKSDSAFTDASTANAAAAFVPKGHVLHLIDSFALAGVAESLHVLRFDRNLLRKRNRFHGGHDVLLLSFARFQWVVVGYDRRLRTLATLAMYAFNEDAIGPGATLQGEQNGRTQLLGLSTTAAVRVDPQTRCSAMLLYANQVVVVPFRSGSIELSVFDEDDDDDGDDDELADASGKDDDDDDDEEQKLQALVNETNQRGNVAASTDVHSRLLTILDKSVKIGRKRKRNKRGVAGLLPNEIASREFLLRLPELGIAGKVVDLAFLDGYLEPTLMLLHEDNDKNATDGRFAAGYDTFCLTVLSINLNTRLHPKIWSVKNLPSDCFQLIPCRAPVGGAIVLSANAILYFNQTQFYGRATNVFATETVSSTIFPLADAVFETRAHAIARLNLLLFDCQFEYLGTNELVVATPDGALFTLALPSSSNRATEEVLALRQIYAGPAASCLSVDALQQTLFLGSRSGDSLLFAYAHQPIDDAVEEDVTDTIDSNRVQDDKPIAAAADAIKMEETTTAANDDSDDDEDDLFLYGASSSSSAAIDATVATAVKTEDNNHTIETAPTTVEHPTKPTYTGRSRYQLEPIDVLPAIGQITALDIGVETIGESKEAREELVVSGGSLASGAVSVLHNGLRPIVSTEAELAGCRAMWTVASSLASASSSSDGRAFNAYLILSVAQRTIVLRTGEGMEPLEDDSGFYTAGPTLAAANLFDKQRIVQIFKQGARVMMEVPVEPVATGESDKQDAGESEEDDDDDDGPRVQLVCTQEITLEGDLESGGMNVERGVGIVSVDVIDPFILLLLTDGSIRVLMGDVADLELTVLDPTIDFYDNVQRSTPAIAMGISSACLFYDWAGMFDDNAWGDEQAAEQRTSTTGTATTTTRRNGAKHNRDNESDDDDDEMDSLYATAAAAATTAKPTRRTSIQPSNSNSTTTTTDRASATVPLRCKQDAGMFCGLCLDDGSLHVFALPGFEKKGVLPYLTFAPQSLVNTMEHMDLDHKRVAFTAPVLGLNASTAAANDGRIKKSQTLHAPIADIAIHRVGPSEGSYNAQLFAQMVLLVLLANGDLLLYAALPKVTVSMDKEPVAFAFTRVRTEIITRPFVPLKARSSGHHHHHHHHPPPTDNETNTTSAVLAKLRAGFRYPMLTRFENVNSMSGVFFRGAHPMWIVSTRGQPTFVPMSVPPPPPPETPETPATPVSKTAPLPRVTIPILSFTPFHHWNCPNGFIYYHSSGALRVCELPSAKTTTLLPASGGFVLRKAAFHATIHHLLFLGTRGPGGVSEALEASTFAVVCSTKHTPADAERLTFNPHAIVDDELTDEPNDESGAGATGENIMAPTAELFPQLEIEQLVHTEEDMYELRLVQTNEFSEWDTNGVFKVHFERFEVVLSVKLMYLFDSALMRDDVTSWSREWNHRKRPFVVVGTGFVPPHGEDESGRGRLLLYELDYAQYVDHSGSTTSRKLPKLRLVFIKENSQGAISAVAQLGPYVIAAMGSKLIVYEFKSEQLVGCAFYDAQMFIVSLSIVNDLVLYGDVYKSVHLLKWKERQRQLILLAKDYEPLEVAATEFNILDKRLALLATDMEENVHVLQFAPNDIESRGGQRLLRTGDFHVGVQISSIVRKRVPPTATSAAVSVAYVNLLGSSEGSVSALVPVTERVFRRLFTLQNVLINTLPQNCALNPRAFRALQTNSHRKSGRPDAWSKQKWKKSFLDAYVLFQFLDLDYVAQKEVTRCIGTTPEVVVHNLLEVQRATASFL